MRIDIPMQVQALEKCIDGAIKKESQRKERFQVDSCIQSMRSDIPKHKRKTWVYPDEATKGKRKRKTTTRRFMHANEAGNKKKYTYIQTKDKIVDEATNGRNTERKTTTSRQIRACKQAVIYKSNTQKQSKEKCIDDHANAQKERKDPQLGAQTFERQHNIQQMYLLRARFNE